VKVSTVLTRARRSNAALALDPLPASKIQPDPNQIAELDTHNCYFALSIVRRQLQGISLHEPLIYSSATLLLAFCTLLASFLPARKATRLSVHGALRHQ
jgi:ABC-type lipoprotein release transport system permease subunit